MVASSTCWRSKLAHMWLGVSTKNLSWLPNISARLLPASPAGCCCQNEAAEAGEARSSLQSSDMAVTDEEMESQHLRMFSIESADSIISRYLYERSRGGL